jgi:hypothetical protein
LLRPSTASLTMRTEGGGGSSARRQGALIQFESRVAYGLLLLLKHGGGALCHAHSDRRSGGASTVSRGVYRPLWAHLSCVHTTGSAKSGLWPTFFVYTRTCTHNIAYAEIDKASYIATCAASTPQPNSDAQECLKWAGLEPLARATVPAHCALPGRAVCALVPTHTTVHT